MTQEKQTEGKVVRLSTTTKQLLEIDSRHSAGGIFPLPVFIKSGKGSTLKVGACSPALRFSMFHGGAA